MKRDPFSEIQRAAQDERGEQDRRSAQLASKARGSERAERKAARVRLEASLTGGESASFFPVFVFSGWPLLLLILAPKSLLESWLPAFLTPLRHSPRLESCLWFFGCIGLTLVLMGLYGRTLMALRVRRIYRIGHGFDAKRYLDQLSREREHGTLVARFGFARAWDQEHRGSTREAVRHWMPELGEITWIDDSTLEVRSESLSTTVDSMDIDVQGTGTGMHSYYSNRAVHDCFVKLVRHVLPKLDAAVPVQHLDVNIEG